MIKSSVELRVAVLGIICLLLPAIASCSGSHPMAGRYKGVEEDNPGSYSFIELDNRGQGVWETEIDYVHFTWEIRDGEIWMFVQGGREIRGVLTPEGFDILLPEVGIFVFVRQD